MYLGFVQFADLDRSGDMRNETTEIFVADIKLERKEDTS